MYPNVSGRRTKVRRRGGRRIVYGRVAIMKLYACVSVQFPFLPLSNSTEGVVRTKNFRLPHSLSITLSW